MSQISFQSYREMLNEQASQNLSQSNLYEKPKQNPNEKVLALVQAINEEMAKTSLKSN